MFYSYQRKGGWIDRFKLLKTRWIQCREATEPGQVELWWRERAEAPGSLVENPPIYS